MLVDDHLELYKFLEREKVKYIVIGGVAAIAYGVPRTTNDIDIFIEPTTNNCKKLLKALIEAGLNTAFLTTAEKISANELTVIEDIIRMDVLTKVKGLDFANCWDRRVTKKVAGIPVDFVSLDDLIKSKTAAHRKIDIEDIKILKKIKKNY